MFTATHSLSCPGDEGWLSQQDYCFYCRVRSSEFWELYCQTNVPLRNAFQCEMKTLWQKISFIAVSIREIFYWIGNLKKRFFCDKIISRDITAWCAQNIIWCWGWVPASESVTQTVPVQSFLQQDMRSPSKWKIFQLWQAASCCPYCCLPRKSLEMVRKYSTFKSWKIFFSDHHNYFRKWSSRTISYFCLNLLETVFQGTGSIGLRMKIFWFSKALSYLL